MTQKLTIRQIHETAGTFREWAWSNQKAPQHVVADSLKTTTQAVDERGVSGALLAAMLDAWTPRAKGMQHLAPYATASKAPGDNPVSGVDPQRVSFHHDSRASTYADGSTDTNAYSPATGDYLYVFSTGAWLSEQVPNTRSQAYPQNTLAIHVNASTQNLTLPRWAGLNIRGRDWQLKASQLYEGEQLSSDGTARTIAANELIMFGLPVQAWYDPERYSNPAGLVQVRLTIEQSQSNPRTVDLCWGTSLWHQHVGQYCTTFTVPEGWTAGQPLQPQGFYAEAGEPFLNDGIPTWSTQAAGN